jgi:lipopolysaccharide export system protein LptA
MTPAAHDNTARSYGAKPLVSAVFLIAALSAAVHAAHAQLGSGAFGSGKDANLPVAIEANLLEIHQDRKQAIFTGRVIATRGTVRVLAQRLIMHYTEKKLRGGRKQTEVKRINAYGNVIVTSRAKKATGQWAIMYMAQNKVVMGDKVVVIEDKTVLRGSRLELDLKTGKTRLLGPKNTRGRVSGIFVPEPPKKQGN